MLGEIVGAHSDGTVVARCATGVTTAVARTKVLTLSRKQQAHVQRMWEALWPQAEVLTPSSASHDGMVPGMWDGAPHTWPCHAVFVLVGFCREFFKRFAPSCN